MQGPLPDDVVERFQAKVDLGHGGEGCHEWLAGELFGIDERPYAPQRVAWWIEHGEPPPPLHAVRRACGNSLCVNPDHLVCSDTPSRFDPPRGSEHPRAKLTESVRAEIVARLDSGEIQQDLAAEYGVTQSLISRIYRRKAWTHAA